MKKSKIFYLILFIIVGVIYIARANYYNYTSSQIEKDMNSNSYGMVSIIVTS